MNAQFPTMFAREVTGRNFVSQVPIYHSFEFRSAWLRPEINSTSITLHVISIANAQKRAGSMRLAVTLTGPNTSIAPLHRFNLRWRGHPSRSFVLDYGFVARVTRVTRIFGSSKEIR